MIVFTIVDKDGGTETLKTSRTKLTVGGAYTDDITLLGQGVSSEYGMFRITGEEVAYTDNGFGTLVSEREIVGESIPVTPADSIAIGSSVITYRFEQDTAALNPDVSSSKSTRTGVESPFQWSEPARPAPPGFPTPEAAYPRAKFTDATSSRTSSTPEAISPRPLIDFKQIKIPETKKQELTQSGLAIFILFLMVFFWPLGFLANIIAWKYINRDAHNREVQTGSSGCIGSLLVFNVIILVISLLVIGMLVFTAGSR